MIYFTGVSNRHVVAAGRPDIGLMLQPGNSYHLQIGLYPHAAVDNGCYGGRFDRSRWLRLLDRVALHPDRVRFCASPDRFDPGDLAGNHPATVEMWAVFHHEITDRGLPSAFVAQNGCSPDDIPPEADAVFVGGDTLWKLSERAWAVVAAAKAHGLWAHIGRVNSRTRLWASAISMADSADGTYLRHGRPEQMLAEVSGWLDAVNGPQSFLPIFGGRP